MRPPPLPYHRWGGESKKQASAARALPMPVFSPRFPLGDMQDGFLDQGAHLLGTPPAAVIV